MSAATATAAADDVRAAGEAAAKTATSPAAAASAARATAAALADCTLHSVEGARLLFVLLETAREGRQLYLPDFRPLLCAKDFSEAASFLDWCRKPRGAARVAAWQILRLLHLLRLEDMLKSALSSVPLNICKLLAAPFVGVRRQGSARC